MNALIKVAYQIASCSGIRALLGSLFGDSDTVPAHLSGRGTRCPQAARGTIAMTVWRLYLGILSKTTIRRFEVTRLIARGGMGEVYLAKDAVLGRELALKILRQDVTRDPARLERFIHEARAASALNHPHLISIYDIGESAPKRNGVAVGPPVLYIAMELVSGKTLRNVIEDRRPRCPRWPSTSCRRPMRSPRRMRRA